LTVCRGAEIDDLAFVQSATVLTISPGTEHEKVYLGQDLKDFLNNFELDKNKGLRLVFNSQKGNIVINGKKYPVDYCIEKIASEPVILKINADGRTINIKEKK